MALREKVLRIKASKFELRGLEKNRISREHLAPVDQLLNDVYFSLRPNSSDYENRRDLIRVFNEIAKEIYGKSGEYPVVEEFGSFLMDLFTAKSDLDLSVNFGNGSASFSREKKIQAIRKFTKKFYQLQKKGHVSGITPVTNAIVPVVKVVDRGTGVECDVSIENTDGILKSKLIRLISSIDERFPKLSFLMKAWAKAQGINSSKDRTLNSLSIILLVAFNLQTCDPPILPPFSAIFEDGSDPTSVDKAVRKFLNYGKKNKESLAHLFITMLIKMSSVERLWSKGLCASTYQGSWISKTWSSKIGCISVEDFTERSNNVARAVGTSEVKKIQKCIQDSIQHIFAFMGGLIQGPRLRELLFGHDGIPILSMSNVNHVNNRAVPCISLASVNARNLQPMNLWERRSQDFPSDSALKKRKSVGESPNAVWGGAPKVGWGSVPARGWGAKPTEAWTGTSVAGWEGAGRWGAAPTTAWGAASQSTISQGGRQLDTNLHLTWSKRTQYTNQQDERHGEDVGSVYRTSSMPHSLAASASSLGGKLSHSTLSDSSVHKNRLLPVQNRSNPIYSHQTGAPTTYSRIIHGAGGINGGVVNPWDRQQM